MRGTYFAIVMSVMLASPTAAWALDRATTQRAPAARANPDHGAEPTAPRFGRGGLRQGLRQMRARVGRGLSRVVARGGRGRRADAAASTRLAGEVAGAAAHLEGVTSELRDALRRADDARAEVDVRSAEVSEAKRAWDEIAEAHYPGNRPRGSKAAAAGSHEPLREKLRVLRRAEASESAAADRRQVADDEVAALGEKLLAAHVELLRAEISAAKAVSAPKRGRSVGR